MPESDVSASFICYICLYPVAVGEAFMATDCSSTVQPCCISVGWPCSVAFPRFQSGLNAPAGRSGRRRRWKSLSTPTRRENPDPPSLLTVVTLESIRPDTENRKPVSKDLTNRMSFADLIRHVFEFTHTLDFAAERSYSRNEAKGRVDNSHRKMSQPTLNIHSAPSVPPLSLQRRTPAVARTAAARRAARVRRAKRATTSRSLMRRRRIERKRRPRRRRRK